jgi:hypothetical protein
MEYARFQSFHLASHPTATPVPVVPNVPVVPIVEDDHRRSVQTLIPFKPFNLFAPFKSFKSISDKTIQRDPFKSLNHEHESRARFLDFSKRRVDHFANGSCRNLSLWPARSWSRG